MTHHLLRTGLLVTTLIGGLALAPSALAVDAPHDQVACTQCHEPHGATYPSLLGQLCSYCHFLGGPATPVESHSSLSSDASYGNWDLDCWACHDPHYQQQDDTWGTNYGGLLRVELSAPIKEIDPGAPGPYYPPVSILRTVSSSIVEHTSPTTFVDGDGLSDDDICQVCHLATSNYDTGAQFNSHTNYGPESQPGGDCAVCHPHDGGFSTRGCTLCHDVAQGNGGERRQVVGPAGDFVRPAHHVTDGSQTEMVDDPDCVVCHDQYQHQTLAEPAVRLFDADTKAVSYTFDGGGASLEGFCRSCHDADSSLAFDADGDTGNGYQPFADGLFPTDIDSWWSGSSHDVGLAAEACLGCHGGPDSTRPGQAYDRNGHGSDRMFLTSATVAGETATNEEEGLCFACHDGAPAATGIEAEFAKGTNGADIFHHPVLDGEQSPGREVECADCHDAHRATTADVLFGATGLDLAGAPVGPDGPVEQYEVCFKCHGDSYNAARPRTTNKRTDFDPANSAFHPVAAAGQNTSQAMWDQLLGGLTPNSVLACSDCHNNEQTADVDGAASGSMAGPQGPHGSTLPSLLRDAYWNDYTTGPGNNWNAAEYGLCFLCHDETALIEKRYSDGARTNFNDGANKSLHEKHVFKEPDNIACVNCHYNVHGNQNAASNTDYEIDGILYGAPPVGVKTRLVSFSPDCTGAGGYANPTWTLDTFTRRRGCAVDCHGKNHNPKEYDPYPALDDDPLTY